MKKIIIIICFLFTLNTYAVTGDANNDGKVDALDLYIFADEWLTSGTYCDFIDDDIVNFLDFAALAENWTGRLNGHPTANNIDVTTTTYTITPIILQGSDDGLPNPPGKLKYIITALPDDAGAYVQDPVSGGQVRIRYSDLPYTLSTWGNVINFGTANTGSLTIKYKTFDKVLFSEEKTISLIVNANPQDCLSFNGSGLVTIADSDYFDLVNARAVGVCFATRQPFCTLFKKYQSGQAGYEMKLVAGRIFVNVYNSSGLAASVGSANRYDSGSWVNACFGYNNLTSKLELYIGTGSLSEVGWFVSGESITDDGAAIAAADYTNSVHLIIGQGYKGEIDAIRSYTLTMTDNFRSLCAVQPRQTAGNSESYVPAPVVRFTCNYDGVNNTATQIYDDKAFHLVGTISSSDNVRYIPFYWHWYDSAFFHQVSR